MPTALPAHVLLVTPAHSLHSAGYAARPLAALARAGRITFKVQAEEAVQPVQVRAADVVLFQHSSRPDSQWILHTCLERRIPTAFILDTNLWEAPSGGEQARLNDASLRYIEGSLGQVDWVYVYHPTLQRLALNFNSQVRRLLPSIDLRGLPDPAPARRDGRLRLAFLAGHAAPPGALVDDLERALQAFPGLFQIDWWGAAPERLAGHPALRLQAAENDLHRLLRALAAGGYDIGLAPTLPAGSLAAIDNRFALFGAAQIAGLYSESDDLAPGLQHSQSGWLAPHRPGAWYEALLRMVTDRPLRQALARCAHQRVQALYRQELAEQEWRSIVGDLPAVGQKPDFEDLRQGVEQVYAHLSEQDEHNRQAGHALDQVEGELGLQLPLARTLAHEVEAYRSRKLVRLTDGRRPVDPALSLAPAFGRLLDDSRLFGLAGPGSRLRPSPDLARTPLLLYRLPVSRPGLRAIWLAPLFDLYPQAGVLRLEIASSAGAVQARAELPAAGLRLDRPAVFTLNALLPPGPYQLRLSARDLDVPVKLLEWSPARLRLRPALPAPLSALDFYTPSAEGPRA